MKNQTLYDLAIQHFADVRLYEEGLHTANGRVVRRHERKLRDLIKRGEPGLQLEVSRFMSEIHTTTNGRLSDLDAAAESFHTNALHKVAGSYFQVQRPETTQFDPRIGVFKTSLRSELVKIGDNHLGTIERIIRDNPKATKAQIADLAADAIPMTSNKVKTLARTLVTQVENSASERVMAANSDILAGYRFTAILDSRTSAICMSHNGRVYPLGEVRYRPPLHWNCRSFLVPVLQKGAKISSPRITGPVPDVGDTPGEEGFSDWLRRQPSRVQMDLLGGEDQMTLFQRGKIAVSEFFTVAGKKMPLEKLRLLDNKRTTTVMPEIDGLPSFTRPSQLIRAPAQQDALERMYVDDAESANQMLGLMDYKGVTILGKRTSRARAANPLDERVNQINPWSGEAKNTLVYDPDFTVLQEKLDSLTGNRALEPDQRLFISEFVNRLNDKVSVNQQSAILDNLRVSMERYNRNKQEWGSAPNVLRAEMKYSVQNVSAVIDLRSRKGAETFGLDESVVRIGSNSFTFNELQDGYQSDVRYLREWNPELLAAKLVLQGKAPLGAYLDTPKLPKLPKLESLIGKRLNNYVTGTPQESILQEILRKVSEPVKRVVNLDFSIRKIIRQQLPRMPSNVDVMSGILREIASGHSSDYDTLAIKVGERAFSRWKLHDWQSPSLQERHRVGSEILEQLRKDKYITVSKRGVTRRAAIDIDTGRPNGEWKDTISREVTVIDPGLKEIQLRERKVMLAQRLGLIQLEARPGQKVLFDQLGNKSGVSVITRNASNDYDPKLLDDEFIKMLNHTMKTEYTVDMQFGSFMDELARFRDDKGKSKEFDELNKWRQLIIQRGDQGYGFLQTVRHHTYSGRPFTVPAQIDGRGRVYHMGYLSPTGGEVARPFLNSAKAYDFGKEELKELMLQTGALIGPATDALTQAGRYGIFEKHEADILSLGRLLTAKTQRQQKMRDFLKHPLVMEMDAEEVPKLTRLALEYARVYDYTGGDFRKLGGYKTQLMIENDASSSGAQIIGLSTGDRDISINSNVLATSKKNRLYDLVAMDTAADPRLREIPAFRHIEITWEDLQKAAKSANMVAFYGAGDATQAANIEAKFASVLGKKGLVVITKAEMTTMRKAVDKAIKDAEYAGATAAEEALVQLRRELMASLKDEVPLGRTQAALAREIHPDVANVVDKLQGNRVVRPKDFDSVAELMSEHLGRRAPVTTKFTKFWNEAAKLYIQETGSTDIPWVTFDGKRLFQRYRVKEQTSIEWFDPETKRMVRNVYEERAKDGVLKGKSSVGNARIGMGVNGNHMNDATIVRRFHLWGAENKVPTATIHDAFFTSISHVSASKRALREIYADAAESNTIRKTLLALKDSGMSDASYRALVARAIADGLIDPPNKVTRSDILAPIPAGKDWYGIGP